MSSCLADPESFIYHIEDRNDTALSLVNMVIDDVDLWTGHIAMDFDLAIAADLALSQKTPVSEAPKIDNKAGKINRICVRSRGFRDCAISQDDALGRLPVLLPEKLEMIIHPERVRPRQDDGTCQFAGGPYFLCESITQSECRCYSRTYFPTDGDATLTRRAEYRALMFYSVVASVSGEEYETGFLDLIYTSSDLKKYTVVGQLIADAGKISSTEAGPDIDWFPASPMVVSGEYTAELGKFRLKAETKADINPIYSVDVWSEYGSVFLPESQVPVLIGSPTCVDPASGRQRRNDTCKTVHGTINQINQALTRVEYVVPNVLPHFNTMSLHHSLYGAVDEYLRVRVNDHGASGVECRACRALQNSLLLDFNVVVVSENDRSGTHDYRVSSVYRVCQLSSIECVPYHARAAPPPCSSS